MDYKQSLQIIEIILWIVIILACIVALLRGRVFAIQLIYTFIFINITVINSYFQNYLFNTEVKKEYLYFQTIIAILLLIITIAYYTTLSKRYLFVGIKEKEFLEVINNILEKNKYHYKIEEKQQIRINESIDDVYQYASLAILEAGSSIYVKNTKKGKTDQLQIIPKLKESLLNYPLNKSGKILLSIVILFSTFILFTTYLLIN